MKQNVQLCEALKGIEEYIFKKREKIAELVEKYDIARVHRDEHFRDLSTFEFNFAKSKNYKLCNNIDSQNARIASVLSDMNIQTF